MKTNEFDDKCNGKRNNENAVCFIPLLAYPITKEPKKSLLLPKSSSQTEKAQKFK